MKTGKKLNPLMASKTGIYTQESNGSKMLSPNLEMLLSDHE